MNYSIETQERKTRRKALLYTFLVTALLFGTLLFSTGSSVSKLTDTVKELIQGDQDSNGEVADLEDRA